MVSWGGRVALDSWFVYARTLKSQRNRDDSQAGRAPVINPTAVKREDEVLGFAAVCDCSTAVG